MASAYNTFTAITLYSIKNKNWLVLNSDPIDVASYTYIVLSVLDCLYIGEMIYQRFFSIGYPDPKWTKTRQRLGLILVHVIFGFIAIFMGSSLVLLLNVFPDYLLSVTNSEVISTTPTTKIFGYVIATSVFIHALSCIPMNTIPYGNRNLTVPMYFLATILNFMNSITLFVIPNDLKQMLNTWAGINIFIIVRLQGVISGASVRKIISEPWYSYILITSGLSIIALTQQNPWFFLIAVLPTPTSYLFRKIQFPWLKVDAKESDKFDQDEDIIPDSVSVSGGSVGSEKNISTTASNTTVIIDNSIAYPKMN